ncbi:DUF5305 family protein [Natronorubrum aibiense]|uniref:DUF5305 domain-containing protein n=1 Tax=Natronorubrum aibiense TaxID=348826 RepID=A0A5P9P892_9EURY|nr:DUF5305 family protein [Natronorubrum aibiense]QFU84355.1 hypothetical protein GCU68_17475 [Natronorubrum aibiense]
MTDDSIDSDRREDVSAMNELFRRIRVRLYDQRVLAVLAIVCLLCIGGWLSYTVYVAPSEQTEQRVTDSWTLSGTVTHGADIRESTPIYDGGEVATDNESTADTVATVTDEPVYYTDLSPAVHGDVAVGYDADRSDNVTVSLELERVTRAAGDDVVYWSDSEQLDHTNRTDVESGEEVVATFNLNVSHLEEQIDEIETNLGASPGDVETYINAIVTVEGEIGTDSVSMTRTFRIDLTHEGSMYSIDVDEPLEETGTETETVAAPRSYGPLHTIGGPTLVAVGVVGAGATALACRRSPTDAERAWLSYLADRDAAEDVIVRVDYPVEHADCDHPVATVPTLGELAQLAIDVEAAVLEDVNQDRYVVEYEGGIYVYEPPADSGRGQEQEESRLTSSCA